MDRVPNSFIEQQLAWRYATKHFDPSKKISSDDWNTLEESLRLAPSSFGLQPWRFIVVQDLATRQQLLPHSWNQPQVTEASHLIVIAAQQSVGDGDVDAFINHISHTRGVDVAKLSDYSGMMKGFLNNLAKQGTCEAWTTRQCYIALGMLLSSAAMLKIDTCPLEGISPTHYDEALGLQGSGFASKVACALGYRSASDAASSFAKVRYPADKVFIQR